MSLDTTGVGKENSLIFSPLPIPKVGTDYGQERISSTCDFSCSTKGVGMSECPASPAVWDAAKEAHCSLAPSEELNHELYDWGGGRGWESGR